MKADSETNLGVILDQFPDSGNNADGRYGDATRAEVKTLRRREPIDGTRDRWVIMERFTHAHEHDLSHTAKAFGGGCRMNCKPLRDNLARVQVASQLHGAGGAEGTSSSTADLAGDAKGSSILCRNPDRLDR